MSSIRPRARGLETVMSIGLLAVLVIIAIGVFLRQSDGDIRRFGVDIATEKSQTAGSAIDLSVFLPDGFKATSETESYNAENLYVPINGKATLYTEAGFCRMYSILFASESDPDLALKLYVFDMGNARNAFSVYSRQKRAGVDNISDLGYAYTTSSSLHFAGGKYYVEFIGFAESKELVDAMEASAHKIITQLVAGSETTIAELKLFPKEGLVEGSEKFSLSDAFGFEGMKNIFSAQYRVGDEVITAFLGQMESEAQAEAMVKSYHEFLIEMDAKTTKAINRSLEGAVLDFYDMTEIVLSRGVFVLGIHEADNRKAAEEMVLRLIEKVSKAKK